MDNTVQLAIISLIGSIVLGLTTLTGSIVAAVVVWMKIKEAQQASEARAREVRDELAREALKVKEAIAAAVSKAEVESRKAKEELGKVSDKMDTVTVKQDEQHRAQNSRMDELLIEAKKSAHAEGKAEGLAEGLAQTKTQVPKEVVPIAPKVEVKSTLEKDVGIIKKDVKEVKAEIKDR